MQLITKSYAIAADVEDRNPESRIAEYRLQLVQIRGADKREAIEGSGHFNFGKLGGFGRPSSLPLYPAPHCGF